MKSGLCGPQKRYSKLWTHLVLSEFHSSQPSHRCDICLFCNRRFSIGVTTGIAFCGVVGHTQRHEYTGEFHVNTYVYLEHLVLFTFHLVISQKVNMAARLMIKYPNQVTCDETTMLKSKLPEEDFVEQAPVTLKGIADPGTIYAYSTVKYVMCTYVYIQNIQVAYTYINTLWQQLQFTYVHVSRDCIDNV